MKRAAELEAQICAEQPGKATRNGSFSIQLLAFLSSETALFLGLLLLLLPFYEIFYLAYLKNEYLIGYDYSLFMPDLLAGYYWYLGNGLFSLPWFSPAQCGGVPFFADPNVAYFSVPQFLSFVMSPLKAIRATVWLFAIIGYCGTYLLVRRSYGGSRSAALLGAALFMFNGFFGFRMLAGHLTYHAYMLLPLFAAAILPTPSLPDQAPRPRRWLWRVTLGGCCLGYMFQAGMIHIIPPVLLDVIVLILVHAALFGWARTPWLLLGGSMAVGLVLAAGKLAADAAFLAQFPRDLYSLPGLPGLFEVAALAFRTLFLQVSDDTSTLIVNSVFRVDRHELEYGVSAVPLVLVLIWAGSRVVHASRSLTHARPQARIVAISIACGFLLAVPLLLNWYEPNWNKLFKNLPFSATAAIWYAGSRPTFCRLCCSRRWQRIGCRSRRRSR